MHPRIAARREKLKRLDPLSAVRRSFETYGAVLHEGRRKLPMAFWDRHIETMEILCAELDRINPNDPAFAIRTQILIDATQALQLRVTRDFALATKDPEGWPSPWGVAPPCFRHR